MGIAELILALIVMAGVFLAGKEKQKALQKKREDALRKEIEEKVKVTHEAIANSDLQSLIDANNKLFK